MLERKLSIWEGYQEWTAGLKDPNNSAFESPELLNSAIRSWISARPRRLRDGTIEFIRAGDTQVGRIGDHGDGRTLTVK